MFCKMWKLYTIQNSMSLSKVLLEHSQAAFHTIRIELWQSPVTGLQS